MIKKILIVDDISANLYMLETLLKGYGFEVISAVNGRDALDKARLNPPDMIITDILMPVMDGYALCRQWKSDDKLKHIPLIFYTGTYMEPKDEKFALSLGADRFIIKPQEPDILMNMLKDVLKGEYPARQVAIMPLGEEMEFFRQYNKILFEKLEKKMSDLEIANHNLRFLEEKYQLLFKHIMDVVLTIDIDLNVSSVSQSVERILGYKPQDFIGRSASGLGRIFTPESFEQAIEDISLILKGEKIAARIYRLIAKDGNIKYVEVSGSPVMRERKITGMISIARDMTGRKLAEDALRETQDLLNEVGGIAKIGGWKMDLINHKATWTQGTYDIVEIAPGEPVPGPDEHVQYYLPEYRPVVAEAMRALIEDGKPLDFEAPLRTARGNLKWCRAMGRTVSRGGKVVEVYGTFQDITSRRQADDKLRQSEEKYRLLLDNAGEAIFVVQEGIMKFVNPATVRISGHPGEALVSKPFTDFIHPEDREMVFEHYAKRIRGEDVPQSYVFRIMAQDGSVKWVEIHAALIVWEGEAATLNFLIDITSRRQAEEALKKNEEIYRLVVDNMADVITVVDHNLRLTYVSPSVFRLRGYTAEEVMRQTIEQVMTPESMKITVRDFEEEMKYHASDAADPGRIRTVELEEYKKDGSTVWLENHLSSFRDNQNKPMGMIILSHDITDRRKAEKALKESENKYRLLADNVDDVIFVLDINLNYTYASPSVKTLTGYEPEEFLNLRFSETVTPASLDMAASTLFRIMEMEKSGIRDIGKPRMFELEMKRKDGSAVWTELKTSFIRDENKLPVGIITVSRDITERKRTDEKLQQTLESLRKAVGTTIQVLVAALEARDPYTAGHQLRVADLARAIATRMGLPQDKIEGIRMAGSIHDIGKLSIPAEILVKPTKLSNNEFSLIKEHSQSGYDMLKDVESPWPLAQIVYQHHERMNGTGYPRKLKGDEILIEARIMAVADVVEAMASHRPYRPGLGIAAALEEIEKNKGILYDNSVAEACLKLFRENSYQLI